MQQTVGRGANDLFIAAHTRCPGLILVTNNTREFHLVRDLAIENWPLPSSCWSAKAAISRNTRLSR